MMFPTDFLTAALQLRSVSYTDRTHIGIYALRLNLYPAFKVLPDLVKPLENASGSRIVAHPQQLLAAVHRFRSPRNKKKENFDFVARLPCNILRMAF